MPNAINHEIRLKRRPAGLPSPGDFELAETPVPSPAHGQVLVRNIYMSVDPYMRGRMVDRASYTPPFQIGETLTGGAVGQVVASNGNDAFKAGDYVSNFAGWREWFVSSGGDLMKVDPALAPIQAYLGTFGMPGLTAYVGLLKIAELKEGERVFVSAAGGAVGSVACQIAKLKGHTVIGSAGGAEKAAFLKEIGVDHAIDYKAEPDITAALLRAAPEGIDVYFENVGGAHLEAALMAAKPFGRFALCGMISEYNNTDLGQGVRGLVMAVGKSLTLRGFIVSNHTDMQAAFVKELAGWVAEGKFKHTETVRKGIENAPAAFLGLFKGENLGKMLVKLN